MSEEVPFVSHIKTTGPPPAKPSDLLYERGSALRRACRREPPTIEELMKHAERYGTDAIVQTAAELGYSLQACVRLMDHCDRVDAAAYMKEHPHARPPSVKPSEKRCRILLGIEETDQADV